MMFGYLLWAYNTYVRGGSTGNLAFKQITKEPLPFDLPKPGTRSRAYTI